MSLEIEPWPRWMYEKKPFDNRTPIAVVKRAAAMEYGVTVKQIEGRTQQRKIVRARQVAMAAALETSGQSLSSVARSFQRDHTTVSHAARVVAKNTEMKEGKNNVVRRALYFAKETGQVDELIHELLNAANKQLRDEIEKRPVDLLMRLLSPRGVRD